MGNVYTHRWYDCILIEFLLTHSQIEVAVIHDRTALNGKIYIDDIPYIANQGQPYHKWNVLQRVNFHRIRITHIE